MYSVLLVDDEILIREAISQNTKWEELGYELVGTCKDGREAIELLKERPVDLVLTDIYMPYVDGIELARYVYENCRDTRVVIISGYDEFEYAKKALKYQVVEYILKPVTAMELSEILERVKETLDAASQRTKNMKRFRGEYMSNFPVLRGRFLHQLLQGDSVMSEEEIRKKMEDYDVSFHGNYFMTAMIQADDVSGFFREGQEKKTDLALFAVYNIAEEIIRETSLGVAFQDVANCTVLIFSGDHTLENKVLELCERIQESIREFLNITTTIGVGFTVSSIYQLPKSFQDAKDALEYRFQLGNARVIYAKKLTPERVAGNVNVSYWSERIVTAIKGNRGKEIRQEVHGFIQAIRDAYVSRNRSIFYVQNAVLSILNEMDDSGVSDATIAAEEKALLNAIYDKEHLSEVEQDLVHFCVKVSDILIDQKEGYGRRQALMALDYIEKNYADSSVTLNSVCSYLAISTSYFSSIFKSCTGETFIEALTKKRMEKAKALLEHTSRRTNEIAREVGYADPHYFSAAFKKMTGCTPKEYAKKMRQEG